MEFTYSGFAYTGISLIPVILAGPEFSTYVLYMANFAYTGFAYTGFAYTGISLIPVIFFGPKAYLPIQISSLIPVIESADLSSENGLIMIDSSDIHMLKKLLQYS